MSQVRGLNSWIDYYEAAGLDSVLAVLQAVEKVAELAAQERRVSRREIEEREARWRECHPELEGPEG